MAANNLFNEKNLQNSVFEQSLTIYEGFFLFKIHLFKTLHSMSKRIKTVLCYKKYAIFRTCDVLRWYRWGERSKNIFHIPCIIVNIVMFWLLSTNIKEFCRDRHIQTDSYFLQYICFLLKESGTKTLMIISQILTETSKVLKAQQKVE